MTEPSTSNGLLEAVWNLFASIRMTIVLLFSLAATSIIGTLIPQNSEPAAYIAEFGETLFRFFSVLGLFDMYHSWWFQVLMLMLVANIVVCSAERISQQRNLLFVRRAQFRSARFQNLPNRVEFDDGRPLETLQRLYPAQLSGKIRALQIEAKDGGFFLYGETGRWTRWGVYAVHLSVVLLLVGGLIGSILGFDGFVNIPEGESVQQIHLRNSGERLRLPFAIRCDDFSVSFYENGAPKEFRSRLTLLEEGRPVVQRDVLVNAPLRYKGISIFQSSYGSLPAREAVLSFTSQSTGMVYTQSMKIGQEFSIPEGLGTFSLTDLRHNAQFRGHPVGDAFIGRLTPPNASPIEVVLPIRFPTFDRMRRGEVVIAVDEFHERHYTGLQVNKDPGVDLVYVGFILMILGCYVTFFTSHQQLCIQVSRSGNQSRIVISGTANKNRTALERRVQQLAVSLKELKE